MTYSTTEIWAIIAIMGFCTFLFRFSFLGLIGDRKMPEWLHRHLRYTPAAVLPGLVAPLVLWSDASSGALDPARMAAATATLAVAWWRKDMLSGAAAGALTMALLSWLI